MKVYFLIILFTLPFLLEAQNSNGKYKKLIRDNRDFDNKLYLLVGMNYSILHEGSLNKYWKSIGYNKFNPNSLGFNFDLLRTHKKFIYGVTAIFNSKNQSDKDNRFGCVYLNFGYNIFSRDKSDIYLITGVGFGSATVSFKNTPPIQINPLRYDKSYYLAASGISSYTRLKVLFHKSNFLSLIKGIELGFVASSFDQWKFGKVVGVTHRHFQGNTVSNIPSFKPYGFNFSIFIGFGGGLTSKR